MSEFNKLVAIVTGGASGIGAANAELLLERGARVAVLDREVGSVPSGVFGVQCDITNDAQVQAAVTAVAEHFGGVDIVVNNAGIGAAGDITANTDEEWHRVLDVNVVGIARVTRAALPYLRTSSHAAVVNTCSVVATIGVPNRTLYAASKGAGAALTLAMAADHVAEGIRVMQSPPVPPTPLGLDASSEPPMIRTRQHRRCGTASPWDAW